MLDPVLENLFWAASGPLSRAQLVNILDLQVPEELSELDAALARLSESYTGRGLQLVEVASGFQVTTRPEFAKWVTKLRRATPAPMSEEATVTLAIIAYHQPVTRAEIERLRGADSESVLTTLVRGGLVTVIGELERAYLYGTTARFLERFGLRNLADLPPLPHSNRKTELGTFRNPEERTPESAQQQPRTESSTPDAVSAEASARSPRSWGNLQA
ncbi:MAG: SMC-Scp complex subunit ScpB [Nitrospirota bacterium]